MNEDDQAAADLKAALEPGALQKSVEAIITSPPPDSGIRIDGAVLRTSEDLGAEVKATYSRGWFSAAAWAQWWRDKGWAAGGGFTGQWGGKK